MYNKTAHMISFLLLIIGGLNWLLIGLFDWGIAHVLGSGVSKIIYILVGLAAIYEIAIHKSVCKPCAPESKEQSAMTTE